MPSTKYIYIDIRAVCIPLETGPGIVSVRINHYLISLFSELAKEQDCQFQFIVFGRENEINQGDYFSHLKKQNIPIVSIADHFNGLLRQTPPGQKPVFMPLSVSNFITLTYRNLPLGITLFEPALPDAKDTLMITADDSYLRVAKEGKYSVCEVYQGGELNQADVNRVLDCVVRKDVTSILLSSDVDDTLFLLLKGFFSSSTVLNERLLAFFKTMHDRFHETKPIAYQLLTARDDRETKFHLRDTYHKMLDSFSADFMRYVAMKNEMMAGLYLHVFGSSIQPTLLASDDIEPTPHAYSGFFAKPNGNQYGFGYLYTIKERTRQQLPFITTLPEICTADPVAKSACLKRNKKAGRLIVHFDDSPYVIPDVRNNNPDVCMVEIYKPGMLDAGLSDTLKNWLHPPIPAPVFGMSRSSSFDWGSGSFHQIQDNDTEDDFVDITIADKNMPEATLRPRK